MKKPNWWDQLSSAAEQEALKRADGWIPEAVVPEFRGVGATVYGLSHSVGNAVQFHQVELQVDELAWIRQESIRRGFTSSDS